MLSATISRPEIFAKWVEHITENEVYLSSTHRRIVPLNHSQWITCQPCIIKNIKDRSMKDYIYKNINKLHSLKRTGGLYNDSNELLAVAKLSQPVAKDFTKEALIRVKLDY